MRWLGLKRAQNLFLVIIIRKHTNIQPRVWAGNEPSFVCYLVTDFLSSPLYVGLFLTPNISYSGTPVRLTHCEQREEVCPFNSSWVEQFSQRV